MPRFGAERRDDSTTFLRLSEVRPDLLISYKYDQILETLKLLRPQNRTEGITSTNSDANVTHLEIERTGSSLSATKVIR